MKNLFKGGNMLFPNSKNKGKDNVVHPQQKASYKSMMQQDKSTHMHETANASKNMGGISVLVTPKSGGRMGIPDQFRLRDYTLEEITQLNFCRDEEKPLKLAKMLNKMVVETPYEFDFIDATPNDILETTIKLKRQFHTKDIQIEWECECSEGEEAKKNTSKIELDAINLTSIEELDTKMGERYKVLFNKSQEDFDAYRKVTHPDKPNITIDEVCKGVQIREPFSFTLAKGGVLSVRYTRYRDLVDAFTHSRDKYVDPLGKSYEARKKSKSYVDAADCDSLEREYVAFFSLTVLAGSFVSLDGSPLNTFDEKYNLISNGTVTELDIQRISSLFSTMTFGVDTHHEMKCKHCGQVTKRYLRQVLSPSDVLTTTADTGINAPDDTDSTGTEYAFLFGI